MFGVVGEEEGTRPPRFLWVYRILMQETTALFRNRNVELCPHARSVEFVIDLWITRPWMFPWDPERIDRNWSISTAPAAENSSTQRGRLGRLQCLRSTLWLLSYSATLCKWSDLVSPAEIDWRCCSCGSASGPSAGLKTPAVSRVRLFWMIRGLETVADRMYEIRIKEALSLAVTSVCL